MSNKREVTGNHELEYMQPTWLRVSYPYPHQLPPGEDTVVLQDVSFNDRKSHWAYNNRKLGPYTQDAGPPLGYYDKPLLVQYHPIYDLFDDNADYIHNRQKALECEHKVFAKTFDQISLWQAMEKEVPHDHKLQIAYRAIAQFLKTSDGGWVQAGWIGNIAPTVMNMGWMIGGLALGKSVIGPDAVLRTGKIAATILRGKTVVNTHTGRLVRSFVEDSAVGELSNVIESDIHGVTMSRSTLENTSASGELDFSEGITLRNLHVTGNGTIHGNGVVDGKDMTIPRSVHIDRGIKITPKIIAPNRSYQNAR